MSPVSDLFSEAPSVGSTRYYRLLDLVPATGPYGRFVKLICDDDGVELEALADDRHFPYLDPYHSLLQQSNADESVENPVVPVFLDQSGRWRFSWLSARDDFPELRSIPTNHQTSPPEDGKPFRLQVTVSRRTAEAFDRVAASRGMRRQDLLHHLIAGALTWTG